MIEEKNLLQIELLNDKGVLKTYKTRDKAVLLGREKNCHIVVNDPSISRAHLKISWDQDNITVNDLGSSNGTFINKVKLNQGFAYKIFPTDEIILGKSLFKIRLTLLSTDESKIIEKPTDLEAKPQPVVPEKIAQEAKKDIDVVKFLKLEDQIIKDDNDLDIDFKNVGLNLPQYAHPQDHANEVLREAEYMRASLIKAAEVQKERIIDQAKVESLKIANENYDFYKNKVEQLLAQTRAEISKMRYESEILNKEKEQQTIEEIKRSWDAHKEQLKLDLDANLKRLEKDHSLKSELLTEQLQVSMMTEKNKIISETEYEMLKRKREQEDLLSEERKKHNELLAIQAQEQAEELLREKTLHTEKIEKETREFKENIRKETQEHEYLLNDLKKQIEVLTEQHTELSGIVKSTTIEKNLLLENFTKFKAEHTEAELKLTKVKQDLKLHEEEYLKVKDNLENYSVKKEELETSIDKLSKEFNTLEDSFKALAEKNRVLKDDYEKLITEFETAKKNKKAEIDQEIAAHRKAVTTKFEEFKTAQAQSYEKLKAEHVESIKKISIELSQEVSSKLELQFKKKPEFDFEKTLEVVNSVIQIKGSELSGGTAKDEEQLKKWKARNAREKQRLFATSFISYIAITVIGYFAYNKLAIDPLEAQRRELASERQEQILKNKYIANKDSKYREDYVDATLYTQNFAEKYLDEDIQQEFIKQVSRQFLRRWKVNEESVIKVVSASRAFVQTVKEKEDQLTKDRFRSDIEKLKNIEQEMITEHEQIFGSKVRYEDFKKLEKEFFSKYL